MENFKCAFCGCEQTPEGKILKDGRKSDDNAELKAEIKELRKENKELLAELKQKNVKPAPKKAKADEDDGEEKSMWD